MSKDILILYSGGADSRLMLELALKMKKNVYCLLVNYGQKHSKELEVAKNQLEKLGVVGTIVTVKDLSVDSALTGDNQRGRYEDVSEWYVPSRNLLFVSLACSIAESWEIDTIWYGANFSDRLDLFPDCTQEWVVKVNELLQINGSKPIKLEAPLLGMSKEVVFEILEKVFKINESELFSGYAEKPDRK